MRNVQTCSLFEKATRVLCSAVLAFSLFGAVPAYADEPESASDAPAVQETDYEASSTDEGTADAFEPAAQEEQLEAPMAAAIVSGAAATLQSGDSSDAEDETITNIYTVDQLVDAAATGGTFRLVRDLYINIESGQDIYQGGVINVPTDTAVAVAGTISKSIEVTGGKKLKLLMYDPYDNKPHKIYFDGFTVAGCCLFNVHHNGELVIEHDYEGETKDGLYGAVRKEGAHDRYSGAVSVDYNSKFTLGTRISGFSCTMIGPRIGNAVTVLHGSTFTMTSGAVIENCSTLSKGGSNHGAVGLQGATFNFNEGSIVDCVNYAGSGGAILSMRTDSEPKSQTYIGEKAEIRGCKAQSGSAMYLEGGSLLVFKGSVIGCSTFGNEYNDFDGTINVYDATCIMEGGVIQSNTTKGAGSAVLVNRGSTFTATGGRITGNMSQSGQGAIYVTGESRQASKAILDGVEISGNITAGGNRPYGPVQVDDKCVVTMKSGLIKGDGGATWGGSVAVLAGGTFNMEGGTLRGGSSTRFYGGCVFVLGAFNMTGGTIEDGMANWGGAIYQESGNVLLDGGTIANCKATDSATEEGLGGLYYLEGGTATVTGKAQFGSDSNDDDDKFSADTAGGYFYIEKGSLTLNGVTLDGGHAQRGGAIYQLAGTLTLENCTIEDNMASVVDDVSNIGGEGIGGGLCVIGGADATQVVLKGSTTFSNNTADKGAMGKKTFGQDIYLDYVRVLEKRDNDASIQVSLDDWTGSSRVAISAESLESTGERVFITGNGDNAMRGFTVDANVTDYKLARSGYIGLDASFRHADEKWQSITDAASLAQAFDTGGYWKVEESFSVDSGDFTLTTTNPTLVIDFADKWITVRYDKLTKPFITVPEGTRLELVSFDITDQPQGGLVSDLTTGAQTLLNLTGGTTVLSCGVERFKAAIDEDRGVIAQVSGTAKLVLDKANIERCEVVGSGAEGAHQPSLIRVQGAQPSESYSSDASPAAEAIMKDGFICSNGMTGLASPVFVASGVFVMEGGSICHNCAYSFDANTRSSLAVFVSNADNQYAAQFSMRGGSITGNYALDGATAYSVVVGQSKNGTNATFGAMEMTAGTIDAGRSAGRNYYYSQNALSIGYEGTCIMSGGIISGNGIGRCVTDYGKFYFNGGTLQKGEGGGLGGGGISVEGETAEFKMEGGTIEDCHSLQGGAVILMYGMCRLNGGSVRNCTANMGGAFYVFAGGTLETHKKLVVESCTASQYANVAFLGEWSEVILDCTINPVGESDAVEDVWISRSYTADKAILEFGGFCTSGLSIGLNAKELAQNPGGYARVTIYGFYYEEFCTNLKLPTGVELNLIEAEGPLGVNVYEWHSSVRANDECKADPTDDLVQIDQPWDEGSIAASSVSDQYAKIVTYNVTASYDRASAHELLEEVNHEREACGNVAGLIPSKQLEQIAMQRAVEISLRNKNTTSLRPDGSSRYSAFNGYQCIFVCEVDAVGKTSVQDVLNEWCPAGSTPKKNSVLSDKYKFAGVAHATIGDEDYWVIALGDAAGVASSEAISYGMQSVACEVPTNLFNGGTLCIDGWLQTVVEGGSVVLPKAELEMTTSTSDAIIPGTTDVQWLSGNSSVAKVDASEGGASVVGVAVGKTTLTAYVWKDELCERYVSTKVSVTHDLAEHSAVAATCTEDGSSAYWSCNVCEGKYFSDAEGTVEIAKDSWVVAPLGHDLAASFTWGDGLATATAHVTCSRCDFASDVAATVQTSSQGDVFTAVAKATFEGKEYTEEKTSTLYGIEYHLLGGLNAATNPMRYITESATIELAGATRAGYTFAGWYDNEACSGAAVTQIAKGSTGKIELWAKWSYDLRGDITVNGKLNIVDAQVVYDMACAKYGENFEKYPLRENWTIGMLRETADVNHDGEVNSSDAFAIQRAIHYGWGEQVQ